MLSRTYHVGQVLYVLTNKEHKIYPVQIVEEIIKRTVAGESISYIVRIGKTAKTVPLSEIEGEFYEEVETLRDVLIKRVMNTVNSILESAVTKAAEWYDQPEVHSPVLEQQILQPPPTSDKVTVQLPDGKLANLKLPPNV